MILYNLLYFGGFVGFFFFLTGMTIYRRLRKKNHSLVFFLSIINISAFIIIAKNKVTWEHG